MEWRKNNQKSSSGHILTCSRGIYLRIKTITVLRCHMQHQYGVESLRMSLLSLKSKHLGKNLRSSNKSIHPKNLLSVFASTGKATIIMNS